MQQHTLQECGRLFKQRLRQQEQMSLQVLDQVQESISLLRTLYRSRMPFLTTEADGRHSFAELNEVKPTEQAQRTETEKENELEKQQQGTSEQHQQSRLQMMYQHKVKQGQQFAYEEGGRISGVSHRRDNRRLSPDEGLSQSYEKEAPLQRSALERASAHEHTLDIVKRRGEAFGRGQSCSGQDGRQPHTNTNERCMLAASSSQAYIGDGELTDSARQATLYMTEHLPTGTWRQAPVAAASVSAATVGKAFRSAVLSGSCFTSSNEPQTCAPESTEATVTPNNSGDGVLPKRSGIDIPPTKQVHKHGSTRNTLPRCIQQDRSKLHYVQLDQSKALQYASGQMPPWCKTFVSLYPINTRQPNSQAPEHLHEKASSAAAAAAASEIPSEQIFERNHGANFAADPCRNAAEEETIFSSAMQDQTKQRRVPHEGGDSSCCKAQEAAREHGELKQTSSQNSAAPMTGYGKSARFKKTDCRTHSGGGLPQQQRAVSPVQVTTAAAEVSLLPSLSPTESGVCVGPSSSVVAKNKAVVHIRNHHNATTATDGKTRSPAGTAKAVTGSKSDSETDGTSFAISGTCGRVAAHEVPCREMHLEVTDSHTPAGGASLARCRPPWSDRDVLSYDGISQGSSSCSSQSSYPAWGSSTTDIGSEDTEGSFADPSLSAKGGGRNENHLRESWQKWQKTTGHRDGRWVHQKNAKPSRKSLLEPDRRIGARGVQHCQDQQVQSTSNALSQIVGSPTQKSKHFHLPPQQGPARNCVRSRTPDTYCSELSCAYLLHRPCSGYPPVTRGTASRVVRGKGHSTSLPTLSTTTKNCCAGCTCQTVSAQDSGVGKRVSPKHSGTCWKIDADSISTPSPPPLSSDRPPVYRPRKHFYASSVRPATSGRSRLNPCAAERSLFTSCCDNPQQLATRRLDDTRRARPLWKRTRGSLLCRGRYLADEASSRFREFSQEIPPLVARESESASDYASPLQIRSEAALASSRSRYCVVHKKHCKRVAPATPVSCNCKAFSPVASSSPPAAPTVHMSGEAEGSVTSQKTHCRPSACAFFCPVLRSARQDTAYIASPRSCVLLTCVQLENQGRRGSASTSASTPQATYCPLCCQPFHCSASSKAGARQLLLPPRIALKSCSASCEEKAPTARNLIEPPPGTGAVTECIPSSKNKLEDRFSPPWSEDRLRTGTEGERLHHVSHIPVTSGASRCSCKTGNDKQQHSSSCVALPAKSDKRLKAAAAQQHIQVTERGNDCPCDTPGKQAPTSNTGHLSSAQMQRKAGSHDHLTKCSRRLPFVAAPPAWVGCLQAQRLGNTTVSSEGDGMRAAPTCEAETLGSPGSASLKLLKAASNCVVPQSATEGFHLPARRKPSLSERRMRLYSIHQVKENSCRLSFHQRQQDQQFQQEKSNALFPQFNLPPDQYPTTGPAHHRGHCLVPDELYRCNNKAYDYEDAQVDSSSHNNSEARSGFPCSLRCYSASPRQGQPPPCAGANKTLKTVEGLSFSAEIGRVGTKNADSLSERSSTRPLSTTSTHVEDSDSAELSSPPGTTVNRDKIHLPRPQRGTTRRKLPGVCPNGDIDGNSTPDNTSQQREGIFTGKRRGQGTRDELTDTLQEAVNQPTPFTQAHVASKWYLALFANHQCTPVRQRVHPHSSPACCPCAMTMGSPYVKGQRDTELDGETSNAGGQYEARESSQGATHQEVMAEKCQGSYHVKHPQRRGDHRLTQNLLDHVRAEQPGSHGGRQSHLAGKPVTRAPEQDPERHSTAPEYVRALRYEHLLALVHPHCAAAAVTDATEPSAPPQPSAFMFKLAAAEAAAILRQEG